MTPNFSALRRQASGSSRPSSNVTFASPRSLAVPADGPSTPSRNSSRNSSRKKTSGDFSHHSAYIARQASAEPEALNGHL